MGDLVIGKGKENFVKLAYTDSKEEVVSGKLEPQIHTCFVCNKTFGQKNGLTKHMKTHKPGEGHVCPNWNCDKKFAAPRDLRKHVDIVHLVKAEEYKKECPICHVRVQQLKTHIRFIHRNEGKSSEFSRTCPHCEKSFSNDYKVKRHIETVHEGIKHWQCSVCPKKFYEKKDLSRHIRGVHMGEKVDTWRAKRLRTDRQMPGMVVVTKNVLSTVELGGPGVEESTLPVNVLAEEEERATEEDDDVDEDEGEEEEGNEKEEEEDTDFVIQSSDNLTGGTDALDVGNLRFQVSDCRVEENGDIVVEIEEKTDLATKNEETKVKEEPDMDTTEEMEKKQESQLVTLKWGEGSPSKHSSGGKMSELSMRLEEITQDEEEELGEDFVLPEVVGDLPDWLLQGGGELDILKVQEEGKSKQQSIDHKSEDKTKTAFKCGACGKMFVSLDFLKTHIEKVHINYKLPEELSQLENDATVNVNEDKTVFKVQNNQEGKKVVLSAETALEESDREEKLRCDMGGCKKTFSGKGRKLQYKRHVERIHLSIRNKQCPRCDLSFYEKRDLSRHIEAIHLRIRTICPIEGCARPVVRLDQHIKMVHKERKEKTEKCSICSECGASFSRVYDMTRHRENVHRGLKSFQCEKCDRRFTDKRDMKRHHDAVHLNIRQSKTYQCNFCDKNFKFKKLLDSHRLTEHNERGIVEPTDKRNGLLQRPTSTTAVSERLKMEEKYTEEMGPLVMVGEEQEVTLGEEINTVEIDGQLFLVQQSNEGLSLLPVIQSSICEEI